MVHDYGIGKTRYPGAVPEITKNIPDAMSNALPSDKIEWGEKGLWALGFGGMITEWEQEGSLEQEYIVSVIDSYYGLWEPWAEGPSGMWGSYVAKSRDEIAKKDPVGKKV